MQLTHALLALVGSASAFQAAPLGAASLSRAAVSMKGVAPKGPFGGSTDSDEGWLGDNGESVQVKAFEAGTDYLFFQGPAPTTAVQDDLPSFLSADNFADMEITPLQIGVTVVGLGTFAVLLPVLL